MKTGQIIRFLGVLLLAILALAAIRWIDRNDGTSPAPSPTGTPITTATPVADLPALLRGTVAIQTFTGATLVRTGSGTAVTSDGLIVTTAIAAPYGTGSNVYQVMTGSGTIVRAVRVAYDAASGLVLLKAQTDGFSTVQFDSSEPRSGAHLSAVGATVMFSAYVPVVLPVDVVYAAPRRVALSADRTYVPQLYGARLTDESGRTLGMLAHDAILGIIPGSAVNAFVERYLQAPK